MAETKVSVKVSAPDLSKMTAKPDTSSSSFGGTSTVPWAAMAANFPRNAGVTAVRRAVVERAEAYIRAHSDAPIPLARLCSVTGVSERGLRNAFYEVHGMGPKRWMQAERLLETQIALRAQRGAPTTVTEVATEHGFYQLGRFAAIYKKTFGEAPSETLQAAGFIRGRSTHKRLKEHSDVLWI